MGAVYRVRDTLFRRTLALKILAADYRGDVGLKARFLEESQLMGQLQHPGIPPVHDMGQVADGRPYFTMKLIRGETLAATAGGAQATRRRTGRDSWGSSSRSAQTLAYAHSQGVIHRDLKPANVMVGAFGEVQVMDWGLAKVLAGRRRRTAGRGATEIAVRGDPRRDARGGDAGGVGDGHAGVHGPGAGAGRGGGLDERADVFGPGGDPVRNPHRRTGVPGLRRAGRVRQAGRGNVGPGSDPPGQVRADADLVRLATRCLAGDREDRPANAGEVHRETAAHLNGVQQRLRQAELAKKEADVRAPNGANGGGRSTASGPYRGAAGGAGGGRRVGPPRSRRARASEVDGPAGRRIALDELDRVLAAGKTREAKDQLGKIRPHLEGLETPDLERRLTDREADLALLGELDALFGRRWQVMQQVVLEQVHLRQAWDRPGDGTTAAGFGHYTRGVTREQMRDEYAATFRKARPRPDGEPPPRR